MNFISSLSSEMDEKICSFLVVVFLFTGTWIPNNNKVELDRLLSHVGQGLKEKFHLEMIQNQINRHYLLEELMSSNNNNKKA